MLDVRERQARAALCAEVGSETSRLSASAKSNMSAALAAQHQREARERAAAEDAERAARRAIETEQARLRSTVLQRIALEIEELAAREAVQDAELFDLGELVNCGEQSRCDAEEAEAARLQRNALARREQAAAEGRARQVVVQQEAVERLLVSETRERLGMTATTRAVVTTIVAQQTVTRMSLVGHSSVGADERTERAALARSALGGHETVVRRGIAAAEAEQRRALGDAAAKACATAQGTMAARHVDEQQRQVGDENRNRQRLEREEAAQRTASINAVGAMKEEGASQQMLYRSHAVAETVRSSVTSFTSCTTTLVTTTIVERCESVMHVVLECSASFVDEEEEIRRFLADDELRVRTKLEKRFLSLRESVECRSEPSSSVGRRSIVSSTRVIVTSASSATSTDARAAHVKRSAALERWIPRQN